MRRELRVWGSISIMAAMLATSLLALAVQDTFGHESRAGGVATTFGVVMAIGVVLFGIWLLFNARKL